MTDKPVFKMLPLQLPVELYQRLEELSIAEKFSVTQVVRAILDKAICFKDGKATLQEILDVFSQVNSQAASPPVRPLRTSVLKR